MVELFCLVFRWKRGLTFWFLQSVCISQLWLNKLLAGASAAPLHRVRGRIAYCIAVGQNSVPYLVKIQKAINIIEDSRVLLSFPKRNLTFWNNINITVFSYDSVESSGFFSCPERPNILNVFKTKDLKLLIKCPSLSLNKICWVQDPDVVIKNFFGIGCWL